MTLTAPPGTYRLVAPPPPPPRRGFLVAGLAISAVAVASVFGIAAMMLVAVAPARPAGPCDPALASAASTPVGGFSAEQTANARAIVEVGRAMGVPARGWTVALATAMQESTLRNLDHGDRDSLGLFQQRPSMGWGTPAQVRDPAYAARKFYEGLLKVDGWEALPVTVAAQRVQRSAFPAAYAKWEGQAAALVAAVGQVADVSGCASAPAAVEGVAARVIGWARQQLGKPYQWGATGPGAFDCSGLMLRAFGAAGVTLPRTSRAQFTAGPKIPRADAQPGDLVFWGANPANPATISHVAVYIGDGQILEAPQAGQPVRTRALKPTEHGLFPVVVRPGAAA
ncbi:C40 family peptidase [Pseudonocardia sp. CA-107938]|uniref:C40 family peptidase n=1 Tax=Pseudonocardia sp. CA-107938 TaxID=3240021 RepID=UPI003D8B9AC5